MRDLHSNIKAVQHVVNAAITATNTPANGVDLKGFDAAEFLVAVGVVANIANSPQPSWAFKLQESDDDSTYADVTNQDDVLVGSAQAPVVLPDTTTGVFLTIDSAAEDAKTYRVGYIGNKRYVRVVATAANTPGSTPYSVTALPGKANLAPTSD